MKITNVLSKENIIFNMEAKSKAEIIETLSNILSSNPQVKDVLKMKESISEREKVLSTGLGNGFAIPHCRTEEVEGIVAAFGKTSKLVEFDALDNKPVQFIFLIASNTKMNAEHLKLLGKLGKLTSNKILLDKILQAKNSDEIYSVFIESDNSD